MKRNLTRAFGLAVAALLTQAGLCAAEADLSTPVKAVTTFANAIAKGDAATAKLACINVNDKDAKALDAVAGSASAYAKLQATIEAKFGADNAKAVSEDSPASAMKEMIGKAEKDIKIDGDTATLPRYPNDAHPMMLKREGGTWHIDFTSLSINEDPVELAQMMQKASKVIASLTDEVAAGKYKNAAEVKKTFDQRMDEAEKSTKTPTTAPSTK
jgi:hypothetical protein